MNARHQRQYFWSRWMNTLSESLAELWRTPISSLMTIAVLGVTLSLPACFHLMLKNIETVGNGWQEPTQITLFLQKDRTIEQNKKFVNEVEAMEGVEKVHFISSDQGLEDFRQRSGIEDILSYLDDNPLPAVLVVFPDNAHRNLKGARQLLQQLVSDKQQVADGKVDLEWLQRLYGIISVLHRIVGIVEVLLLLALLLIVGNSMRLNILSRRDEIEVLKLVGASDRFIMAPFLCSGFWYGLVGGLLAWILTNLATVIVASKVNDLAALYNSQYEVLGLNFSETLWLIGTGVILSLLASFFALRHHIRLIEPR